MQLRMTALPWLSDCHGLVCGTANRKEGQRMPEVFSAVKIATDVVCRDCLTMEEMVSAQRGITDSLSADDVRAKEYKCSRCNQKIEPFEIKF